MTREHLKHLVKFVVEGVYYLDVNPTEDTKLFSEFRNRPGTFSHMCHVSNVADEILKQIPENPFGTEADIIEAIEIHEGEDPKAVERGYIVKALTKAGWKMYVAADMLGIAETTLRRKIKEYGITKKECSL